MTGITFLAGFEWVKTVNQLRERQRGSVANAVVRNWCTCRHPRPFAWTPSPSLSRALPLSLSLSLSLSSPSRDPFFRSVFLRLITPITCTIAILRAAAAAVGRILSKFCVPSGLHIESFSILCK
jgi:hypothetical protein